MATLVKLFPYLVLWSTLRADNCGNRCTSEQICGDSGTCHERSTIISCVSPTSFFEGHYCLKTQDCCDDGCMPAGSACCRFQSRYCQSGYTCCSVIGCCPPGTFCSGIRCIDDRFSSTKKRLSTSVLKTISKPWTTKPWTAKPWTANPWTAKPWTAKPWTTKRASLRTTRWFENTTQKFFQRNSSLKSRAYAVIMAIVVCVIAVAVVAVLLILRRRRTTSNALQGRSGIVLTAPAQIYGQTNGTNRANVGVPNQTNIPHQQHNVLYAVTNPVAPN